MIEIVFNECLAKFKGQHQSSIGRVPWQVETKCGHEPSQCYFKCKSKIEKSINFHSFFFTLFH